MEQKNAPGVTMRAPEHAGSLSFDGAEYLVADGVVTVPEAAVAAALEHGYRLEPVDPDAAEAARLAAEQEAEAARLQAEQEAAAEAERLAAEQAEAERVAAEQQAAEAAKADANAKPGKNKGA